LACGKSARSRPWNNWAPLGGIATSGPAAASCTSGHLDVFVRGTDNGYWQLGFNGSSWTGWMPEGNSWTSDPAAMCRAASTTQIDIFGRGSTNGLFTYWETAT